MNDIQSCGNVDEHILFFLILASAVQYHTHNNQIYPLLSNRVNECKSFFTKFYSDNAHRAFIMERVLCPVVYV